MLQRLWYAFWQVHFVAAVERITATLNPNVKWSQQKIMYLDFSLHSSPNAPEMPMNKGFQGSEESMKSRWRVVKSTSDSSLPWNID